MKKIILVLIVLAAFLNVNAQTTYYVDNVGTGDTLSTIAEVNALSLTPSDSVLFKRGGEWRGESLIVQWSGTEANPIVIGAYGTGDKPILNGSEIITNWEERGGVSAVSDWSKALNTPWTNTTWQNHRLILPDSMLSINGNYIRLTIKAHPTSDSDIGGMSIGVRSTGDDFSTTPTRVTFDGGSSTTTVLAGVDKVSDWVLYTPDTTADQMVHIYLATNQEDYMYFSGGGESYRSTSSTDNTLTSSVDYGTSGVAIRIISDYEVKTVTNIWGTPSPVVTTANPDARWTSVVIDDEIFMPVDVFSSLDADLEYYVREETGTSTDSVFVYSEIDPALRTAELSTVSSGISCSRTTSSVAYKYATIENIHFKQQGYTGIQIRGLETDIPDSYAIIDNCDFYLTRIYSVSFRYSRHNIVKNCTFDYCGNGPYAAREASYNLISNNTITNTVKYSILAGFTDGHSVGVLESENVTVENNNIIAEEFGGGGIGLDSAHAVIRYNEIICRRYGAIWPNGTRSTDTLLAHHNVLVAEEFGHPFISVDVVDGGKINLYNNTMVSTFVSGAESYMLKGFYNSGNDRVTLKNNIIYNGGTVADIVQHGDEEIFTTNYNVWYDNSSSYFAVANYVGTRVYYPTFASWKATGNGTNSIEADPLFTNSSGGDFSLQTGSPAINIGEDLGFTRDFLDNPIKGIPDIGAYEHQGVFKFMRNITTGKYVTKDGEFVGVYIY